jgi:Tol biopolymer transport system component
MRVAPVAAVAVLALAGGARATAPLPPRGEIFVVGSNGAGHRNLTRTAAAAEWSPTPSPDGRQIAYVRYEAMRSTIWVMNVDGSGQRRLTSGGEDDLPLARHREVWPQWSPDGRRLAYMVWDYAACTPVSGSGCAVPDVWTVDADGSGQRKVLDSAFQPRWSPDGSKLLFQRYDSNPDRATLGVYLARSDGAGVRKLVRATLWGSERAPPAWSPAGRTILYGAGMGAVRLHLLNVDGRRARLLAVGSSPAWSHDGSRIAFTRTANPRPPQPGGSGVWVVRTGGGKPALLVWEPHQRGIALAWARDGRLAYVVDRRLYVTQARRPAKKKLIARRAECCNDSFEVPPAWSHDGRRLYYGT